MERWTPIQSHDPIPDRIGAVIVGGGIIGMSIAFEMARRGMEVLVLERDGIGAGVSGVSAGMLAPVSEAEHETSPLVQLGLHSLERYPSFVRAVEEVSGLPCDLRMEGTLLVARTRDDEAELRHLEAIQRRLGLAAEWLDAREVLQQEPYLSSRIYGALFAAQEGHVDPRAMLRSLHAAVRALGGRVRTGVPVEGIEAERGELVVWGWIGDARGSVRCEVAVLSAGAWSDSVHHPGPALRVRPVKGQVLRLTGCALLRHVVRAPDVYLVPRSNGELVVGATMEERGFDPHPTAGAVSDLLWAARLLVPGIYDCPLQEVAVGFRPATRDAMPVIGPTSVPGLYVATGHFRHGVLLAPATAELLVETITTGRVHPLLEPFAQLRVQR